MKRSVLSILLFLSIKGALSSCVQCNDHNDTCYVASGNITYVKKCKTKGTKCEIKNGLGECKTKQPETNLFPGFSCTKNEDLEPAIKYV